MSNRIDIDTVLTYLLIKKLTTPVVQSSAYKQGLVNNAGRVIKEPETDKEKEALTIFDKLIFKLKRLLGTKLTTLNNFLYVTTLGNDFYNKIIIRGTIEQRTEVERIKRDIKKLQEKYNCELEDIISSLICEHLEKVKYEI